MSKLGNEGGASPGGQRGAGRGRVWAIRICFLLVSTLVAFEFMAQLYTRRVVSQHAQMRSRPDHYFTLSENEVLGFELARNKTIVKGERTLRINKYGIRDDGDGLAADKWRVALLGASVVFGDRHRAEDTISALLQAELDPEVRDLKVLNYAVPAYNMEEHLENLKVKNGVYHAHHIIFILNAGDFAKRHTRFEGSDNGMYRIYHPPRLAGLWLLRKAIYRSHKGGPIWDPNLVSPGFYTWLYRGNRDWGLETVKAMADYCGEQGCGFSLSLLPPGSAFVNGDFLLADEFAEIFAYARQNGIDGIQSIEEFGPEVFDETDHLTVEGNRRLAAILAGHLRRIIEERPGEAPAGGLPGVGGL
jgi:hypothetical protein